LQNSKLLVVNITVSWLGRKQQSSISASCKWKGFR